VSDTGSEALDLAARFVDAIERGDINAVKACYASDATIWHNFDGIDQSVEDNLKVLGWMANVLVDRKYDILRCVEIPGGYVQQHVLRGRVKKTGAALSMPACLVVQVMAGRITRLEEYLDPAQGAVLQG
jgi:ketosteroid isomerase-like protein